MPDPTDSLIAIATAGAAWLAEVENPAPDSAERARMRAAFRAAIEAAPADVQRQIGWA